MKVKVSIISACYNHGKYIHEMLDSVLNQTFQNFEVIIVNDGSTDDTKKILDQIKNEKVRIFHTENHGPAHARNYAIQHAEGEIIMNLDADDKIAITYLEKCVSVLDAKPEVGIVFSDVEFFGAKQGLYKLKEATIANMLYENRIVANACFRKTDWEQTSGYSSELVYGLEDYDLWLTIIELGRDVYKINERLVFYRTYANPEKSRSESRKQDQTKVYLEMIQIFRKHEDLYKKYPGIRADFLNLENRFYLYLKSENPKLLNKYFSFPTFSIITPTYKRPELLKRAIRSVQNQTFLDYEHIIIDDGNDRETAKVVSEFNSPKIRYFVHQKQSGAAAAYNSGIRLARGKFISFLDDDDEYFPKILDKIHSTFNDTKENIGFVWTGIIRVRDDENGEQVLVKQKWPRSFDNEEMGLSVSTAIGNGFGLCVRKECIEKIGFYDKSLMIGEDTDFMIRLSTHFKFRTVPEILVKIHHGHSQLTEENNFEIRWKCYHRILEQHFDFLSKYWNVIYIHCKAYWNLCYRLNKKKYARRMFWKLIRKFPGKFVLYADLFSYERFGKNYEIYKNK